MSVPATQRLTPQEYLALERESDIKHEFYDGQAFAMAGASLAHARIVANLVIALQSRLGGRCEALSSDMRVKVGANGLHTYPDVVVICSKPQLEDQVQDTLLNPGIIFEVLSPSTERYDRGRKFALYQGLESLTDYLLVSQDMARVEHFAREDAGHWRFTAYDGLDSVVEIESIQCNIPAADIFARIDFGPQPPLRDPITT
jgi:Uma2 family endonuclease